MEAWAAPFAPAAINEKEVEKTPQGEKREIPK